MDNNALVPESFRLDAEPIQEAEAVVVNTAIEEDKQLANLKSFSGWEKLSKEMRNDVDKLRNLTGADLAGLPMDKVGEKFLVASLVADHLQKYLDKVENAAKAVADAERVKTPE